MSSSVEFKLPFLNFQKLTSTILVTSNLPQTLIKEILNRSAAVRSFDHDIKLLAEDPTFSSFDAMADCYSCSHGAFVSLFERDNGSISSDRWAFPKAEIYRL